MSPIRLIILIGAAIAAIAAAFLVRNLAQQGPSAPAQPTTVIEHMEITEIKVLVAQRVLTGEHPTAPVAAQAIPVGVDM